MMKNIGIAAAIVSIDQLVKYAIRRCPEGVSYEFLPGFIRITHCTNSGAAFSLFSEYNIFLLVCSILIMIGVLAFVCRKMRLTSAAQSACACLIGGGIGNLLDRVFLGGVTDYLELLLFSFPVFNIADIAITLSAALLMIMTFTGKIEAVTGEEHG